MRNSCAILLALCSFWLLAAEKGEKMDIGKLDKNMAAEKAVSDGIVWHDPTQAPFRLKGLEWFAKNHEFRRLPHVEGLPPAVDNLANHTTGATIAFKTDSRRIQVDVKLLNPNTKMWNMAPLGHSGFDLYEGGPGAWKVVGVTRVFQEQSEIYTNSSEKTMREYLLNFPMYNGVKSLRIGLLYALPGDQIFAKCLQVAVKRRSPLLFPRIVGRELGLKVGRNIQVADKALSLPPDEGA